jgi:hypothetical protein
VYHSVAMSMKFSECPHTSASDRGFCADHRSTDDTVKGMPSIAGTALSVTELYVA